MMLYENEIFFLSICTLSCVREGEGGRGIGEWGEVKMQFLEIKPAPPLQLISIRESPNQNPPVHEVRAKYNTHSLNYFPSRP